MLLRPGSPLYPRTALLRGMDIDEISKEKLIEMALRDQENSLKRTYVKEGYFDAEVKITTEEIEPNLVDLHVSIENADSYVLGKVYVRGHHLRTYAEIESAFRSVTFTSKVPSFALTGTVSPPALTNASGL